MKARERKKNEIEYVEKVGTRARTKLKNLTPNVNTAGIQCKKGGGEENEEDGGVLRIR